MPAPSGDRRSLRPPDVTDDRWQTAVDDDDDSNRPQGQQSHETRQGQRHVRAEGLPLFASRRIRHRSRADPTDRPPGGGLAARHRQGACRQRARRGGRSGDRARDRDRRRRGRHHGQRPWSWHRARHCRIADRLFGQDVEPRRLRQPDARRSRATRFRPSSPCRSSSPKGSKARS